MKIHIQNSINRKYEQPQIFNSKKQILNYVIKKKLIMQLSN